MIEPLEAGEPLLPMPQVECLPELLLALLERRYLSDFDAGRWSFATNEYTAQPLLRELVSLGKVTSDSVTPMAAALSAWHEPGQAVLAIVHGGTVGAAGRCHRMYFGAKRLPGGPAADEYLESQVGSLAAYFPGIELGVGRTLDAHIALAAFLRSAPALAAMSGIPAVIADQPVAALERLARSLPLHEYALMVVAEPLSFAAADLALDACRHLQSEVSSCIGRQINRSRGAAHSTDISSQAPADQIPEYLRHTAHYVQAITQLPILAALTAVASFATDAHQAQAMMPVRRESDSRNWSESATVNLVDAIARSCDDLLSRHAVRIQSGRGWGWWRVAVYVAAESQASLQAVVRAVRAIGAGNGVVLDPIRAIPLPTAVLRDAMHRGCTIDLSPLGAAPRHPLGPDYDSLATCITSQELATLVAPPRQEIPGIRVRDRGEFAVTLPAPRDDAIELGRIRDSSGEDFGPASLTARMLNEHLLVIGTPGSGKTNTCMHILLAAHQRFNVPFLVIEPAKAEYRQLRRQLGDRLRVLSVGDPTGMSLRLNPLAPVRGAPLLGHIDLLKAVFNASFDMHPGMPQILEQALMEVYQERGWDLFTGTNEELDHCSDSTEAAALTPCLADLHDQIERVMQLKGYAGEVRMNLGAALRSRLNGLMLGAKGVSLNVRRTIEDEQLFNQPVVLELQHLRDDEEKAFVMATVFMRLYQFCEVRQRQLPAHRRDRLQHLTLIEEAHRLLAAPPSDLSTGPRGKAIGMFTDMLAELRALGEGFMIAEQIPTKLAPDTLKNTNLKIIHRLTALSERTAAGTSANLKDGQLGHLASLSKGLAVVHGLSASPDDPVAEAALVQVTRAGNADSPSDLTSKESATPVELAWRHGGCRACLSPCDFLRHVEGDLARDPSPSWIRSFAEAAMGNSVSRAWTLWSRWRNRRVTEGATAGADYCWFVHAVRPWLTRVLSAHLMSFSDAGRLTPASRLTVERLSSSFGRLARRWLDLPEFNENAQAAFGDLSADLQRELIGRSPPDLAGCDSCPARCRMLPYLAGIDPVAATSAVSQTLPRPNEAFGTGAHAIDNRVQRLMDSLTVIETLAELPPNIDTTTWRSDWRYCFMTIVRLPNEPPDYRKTMLEAILRKRPVEPVA